MAGKLIVDTIDTDNAFITLNVQQSQIATMNVSGIYSNTGVKMIGANGTVSNTAITGLVTASQIANVANTQITGNITAAQITSVANTQITGNITSSQITSNPTLYGNVSVTGVIGIGGATPSTSGSGISFPATQSASSDANTLDDYEEGSWTPNQGSGLSVVGSFSSSGRYTKIGNMVFLQGYVSGSTSVALGNGSAISTNMPFTSTSTGSVVGIGGFTNANGTAGGTTDCGPNSTQLSGTPAISATGTIYFSLIYQTT